MSYEHIDFMGQVEIEYTDNSQDIIAISIRSPGGEKAQLENKFKDVLYLEFDNVGQMSPDALRFNENHAKEVLSFVEKYECDTKTILINCLVGESRSAAIALYLSRKYNLELMRDATRHNGWVVKMLERTHESNLTKKLDKVI